MLDERTDTRPRARSPSRTTWVGLAAMIVLGGAVLHAAGLGRPSLAPASIVARRAVETPSPEGAASAVLALAEAVGVLSRANDSRRAAVGEGAVVGPAASPSESWVEPLATGPAPAPEEYDSATACIASFIAELETNGDEMAFICENNESWALERRAYAALAHRPGEGARDWRALGSYSLSAIATMRAACCSGAEPLLAVVPGLWCGILRDELRAVGPLADARALREVEGTLSCLSKRGVHLPDRWMRIPAADSRAAFRRFVARARQRKGGNAARKQAPGSALRTPALLHGE